MTPDKQEQMTIDNALAIKELVQIAKTTSGDVDKLITHMDNVLPFRGKVYNLENRVKDLEETKKKWTWWIISTLSTIIGSLFYIAYELLKKGHI